MDIKEGLPRKSVVQIYFPDMHEKHVYFNDKFDLHIDDLVYVEGKLEGECGRVTDINYNFKIKKSDYKRVIALVDTSVHGQLFTSGSHFITFDRDTLPYSKVIRWFKAPPKEEDEYESGNDDTVFRLNDLNTMDISPVIAERGHNYYLENKVIYISLDGNKGYAIVEGTDTYEVEFEYRNGEISKLTCSCFCSYNCKHEFAAMLQLKETLESIGKHYKDNYERSEYFAAIDKATLLSFAISAKEELSLIL